MSADDNIRIPIPMETIEAFCQKWQITKFALFGSVLRDDFGPESDVDVLVTYAPNIEWTLKKYLAMYDEIEKLFGRKVDLVDRESITQSHNYIRRKAILESARTIYVA
jgi:hypothetical protein